MSKKKFVPAANGVLVPAKYIEEIKEICADIMELLYQSKPTTAVAIEALANCIMFCNFRNQKHPDNLKKLKKMIELQYKHWEKIMNPVKGN